MLIVCFQVMAFGLFLMDNKENSIYKMDGKKRINLTKIDRILKVFHLVYAKNSCKCSNQFVSVCFKIWVFFQQLEVVPLYGDMQIKPYHYIQKSLNFDPSRWTFCESSQLSPQSNLLANLEAIREDHMAYISQLARHSNEVNLASSLQCFCLPSHYPLPYSFSTHFHGSYVNPTEKDLE